MSEKQATLLSFGAILLWALLALLTDLTGQVPPFQLAALTFGIGGLSGLALLLIGGRGTVVFRQPPKVWALGVGGLFGYHLLYFTALRAAPAAEASLIAFLWPLLIVLGSVAVTGKRFRSNHLIGAMLGLAGAGLLVAGRDGFTLDPAHARGYLIAFAAAFVWASYSILSRLVATVPTDAVVGFCLVTAILAAIAHLMLEQSVWPASVIAWLAVIGLGLGPVGFAFSLWDVGMKRGDIATLGAASYAAPLFSTLILVTFGRADPTWTLALGCVLITVGAAISALTYLRSLT